MGQQRFPNKGKSRQKRSVHRKKNLRTYSFLVASAILVILIAFSYASSLPKIEHIPSNFPFFSQSWMQYVPADAQYVSYINYEEVYLVSSNTEFFGSEPLLQLYQIDFRIEPQSVLHEVDVQFSVSQNDVTANLIKLRSDLIIELLKSAENSTRIFKSSHYGYPVYGLLMRYPKQPQFVLGYLSVVNDYTVVCGEERYGKEIVERVIDQYVSNKASLFDDYRVRKAVYASGVVNQTLVSLNIGMFATQLNGTQMIVKSIVPDTNGIVVTRSLMFPTEDLASNQFEEAHRVYRNASGYRILGSYLVVTYRYSVDKLRNELVGT